jgi:hypothetical protein
MISPVWKFGEKLYVKVVSEADEKLAQYSFSFQATIGDRAWDNYHMLYSLKWKVGSNRSNERSSLGHCPC